MFHHVRGVQVHISGFLCVVNIQVVLNDANFVFFIVQRVNHANACNTAAYCIWFDYVISLDQVSFNVRLTYACSKSQLSKLQ